MSLHYLGKHEPRKLSFQLCCILSLENGGASACYIFYIYQSIMIILCRQYGCIIKHSVQILFLA